MRGKATGKFLGREQEGGGEGEASIVIQVVKLLRSSDGRWDSTKLRRLLFYRPPVPPRRLLQVSCGLGSTARALRFFEWLERYCRASPLLSAAFHGIFRLARGEPHSRNRIMGLLALSKKRNFALSVDFAVFLIRAFGRLGMTRESICVYNDLDPFLRNTRVRNVLTGILVNQGNLKDALGLLDEMLEPNAKFLPNDKTGIVFYERMWRLDGFWNGVTEEEVVRLVSKFSKQGIFPQSVCLVRLVNKLCRGGKISFARDVLCEILWCKPRHSSLRKDSEPDVLAFNILLHHLCKLQRVDEAVAVFEKISSEEGSSGASFVPDVVTYNTLINGLCKVGRQHEGLSLMQRMRYVHGCSPTAITYNCLMDGFLKANDIKTSEELLNEMKKEGINPNVVTLGILMNNLCKHQKVDEAKELFCKLGNGGFSLDPSVILYNILIDGLCKEGRHKEALSLLRKMRSGHGCSPSTITYNCLIHGLCKAGEMNHCLELLSGMGTDGVQWSIVTYNILIDHLCKRRQVGEALSVFECMGVGDECKPDVVTFSILVDGLCKVRMYGEGVALMEWMRVKYGCSPDFVTYHCLIMGLWKGGEVERSQELLEEMNREGICRDDITLPSTRRRGEELGIRLEPFAPNYKWVRRNFPTHNSTHP